MNPGGPTWVVVPALDEEASIGPVVQAFAAHPGVDRVLVVDNDSQDATSTRARAAGAEVLHESRRGYGVALRAGIEHACARGAARLVLVEADGTYRAEDLERLLDPLERAELVLGSRRGSGGVPWSQELANRAVAALLSLAWPRGRPWLEDVGCTYRAFTAGAWTRMRAECQAPGPEFSPQMLCSARRHRLPTRQVRVPCGRRGAGRSKHTGNMRALVRTALRMLRTIARERLARRGS
jgi:hypothetical protein